MPTPAPAPAADTPPLPVGRHLLLFGLTVLTVFQVGAQNAVANDVRPFLDQLADLDFLARGASFAVPLLAILLTHEFGHYVAARLHRVPASLPFFIPLPGLGFGTLGAVIAMRGPIRSRNALLDIGASGPIAGLVVAIPVLAWGLSLSEVSPNPPEGYIQEGQSLLYLAIKTLILPRIPEGQDVWLHPTALAGWVGLFLTMINLLPWGQLDGGHIAYAIVGERHHRIARWLRRGLLLLFAYNLVRFLGPIWLGRSDMPTPLAVGNSAFWLVWFLVLGGIGWLSGGPQHPPFEPGPLSPRRRALGWACIILFLLLFMPTPWAAY